MGEFTGSQAASLGVGLRPSPAARLWPVLPAGKQLLADLYVVCEIVARRAAIQRQPVPRDLHAPASLSLAGQAGRDREMLDRRHQRQS